MSDYHLLEKRHLRRKFERAAGSYDGASGLQREICDRMAERLSLLKLTPAVMLDAGSGTGYAAGALLRQYPKAHLIELDFALPMLLAASARQAKWRTWLRLRTRRSGLCADYECMPLRSGSVDLVWSNIALAWATDPEAALRESHRVLSSGGLLMFSTCGPDTLKELRDAFSGLDRAAHVNPFIDMHDIGDMLIRCGFAEPVMDMEYFTLTYRTLRDMAGDLKAVGAGNINRGRRRGLMATALWTDVVARYERLRRSDGTLPATVEVVYGLAWKPAPRTGPGGRTVIDIKTQPGR